MPYIKLLSNSFIRIIDNGAVGYICNQISKNDRTYNEIGADFLKEITRVPQSVDDIVKRIGTIYTDVDESILYSDYCKFASDLFENGFVIFDDDYNRVYEYDDSFTYNCTNPKTSAYSFALVPENELGKNTQQLLSKMNVDTPILWSIQIEITGKCNERCIHCYIPNSFKDNGVHMPFNKFKQLIDEFVLMGGLYVTLTGGEALLHKDFIPMLRYCRYKDLQITILSNLISLTEEVVNVLKEINVNMIHVSLYSVNSNIHDKITKVPGSCDKTKKSIEILRENNIPVQISCPILKENRNYFLDVMNYAKSLGTKANIDYNIVAQKDSDVSNLSHRVDIEDIPEVMHTIIYNNSQYTRFLDETPLDITKTESDLYPCGAAMSILNIGSTGDVSPCATWNMSLGNVFLTSLMDVWNNSSKIKELRLVSFADFPKCAKCEDNEYCTICMAKNYSESDNWLEPNEYFCKVAHINRLIVEEWRRT